MLAPRSWLFICVVILAIGIFFTRESARGQGPTFERAMVLKAIKLSGGQNDIGDLPDTVTRIYIEAIKSQQRGMSEQALDEISNSVEAYVSAKARESDLEGQLVSIYERHLTPEDVAQVAAFLSSASGRQDAASLHMFQASACREMRLACSGQKLGGTCRLASHDVAPDPPNPARVRPARAPSARAILAAAPPRWPAIRRHRSAQYPAWCGNARHGVAP